MTVPYAIDYSATQAGEVSRRLREIIRAERPLDQVTPSETRPVPLVWGKTRVAGRLIWIGVTTAGTTTTWKVLYALCEGPITGVETTRFGAALAHVYATTGFYTATTLTGTRPTQTAWASLPSPYDLGYPGVAQVGITTTNPAFAESYINRCLFITKALRHGSGDAVNGDADPALVISDLITNTDYGAATKLIDGTTRAVSVVTATGQDGTAASSYERWVKAAGMWLSPAIVEQRAAVDILREILDSTNADAVWSDGKIKIIPYADEALTGNSVTYTPVTTIQYALDVANTDDFIAEGEDDPITVTRIPDADVKNVWPVEYLDREAGSVDPAKSYDPSVVEDPDPVDVLIRGEKRAATTQLHMICKRDVALRVSRILAQRAVYVRTKYRFRLPWRFCLLEPMDLVSLTDANLGISGKVVRIVSIEEDGDTLELDVEAEEWPFGIASATAYTVQTSEGGTPVAGSASVEARVHEMAARNWRAYAVPSANASLRDVVAGNGTIVAVGETGTGIYSSDGVTWTAATGISGAIYGVTWNGSIFCAVGVDVAFTSPDGITWTLRTIPAGSYTAVTWGGTKFCAVGSGGACATSPDGITWTAQSMPNANTYRDVEWNGSLFCAVSQSSSCATSPDGVTWTARAMPTGAYESIAWNGYRFVAVGGPVAQSLDGITWTGVALPSARSLNAITWSGAIFCALASDGGAGSPGAVLTSRDGLTWVQTSQGLPTNWYTRVTWTGSLFCAVTVDPTNYRSVSLSSAV